MIYSRWIEIVAGPMELALVLLAGVIYDADVERSPVSSLLVGSRRFLSLSLFLLIGRISRTVTIAVHLLGEKEQRQNGKNSKLEAQFCNFDFAQSTEQQFRFLIQYLVLVVN